MNSMSKLSLADKAYQTLKEAILNNDFQPGAKLKISELRDRYNIGNCPLREALAKLAAVGVIECEPMKGYRVPVISVAELDDIYHARIVVTKEVLRLVVQRADDEWEAQLVAAHHQLKKAELDPICKHSFESWQAKHRQFYLKLIEGCKSPTLIRFEKMLYDQTERYRRLWFRECQRTGSEGYSRYASSHQEYVDAIIRGDAKGLVCAYESKVDQWLAETRQYIIALCEKNKCSK